MCGRRELEWRELWRSLAQEGVLAASIKVPDAAAPLDLVANLRTRQLTTSATINAPKEGRPQTRVNWILRQAREMPADLRVEARYPNAREHPSMLLGDAREHPERLLYGPDPKREARAFDLALVWDMGRKRGRGPGSFVGDSRSQLLRFYRDVLQQIRAWQPPAPKLPRKPRTAGQEEAETQQDRVPAADVLETENQAEGTG